MLLSLSLSSLLVLPLRVLLLLVLPSRVLLLLVAVLLASSLSLSRLACLVVCCLLKGPLHAGGRPGRPPRPKGEVNRRIGFGDSLYIYIYICICICMCICMYIIYIYYIHILYVYICGKSVKLKGHQTVT